MKMTLVSAIALAAAASPTIAVGEDVTAWRLFVSDHAAPIVSAIDALEGDVLATLELKGPASLYASQTGEAVYAVQGDAGTVSVISTGIAFDDHGGHADLELGAIGLSPAAIMGDDPVHQVEHDGHWATFFDGEGLARIYKQKDVLAGNAANREVVAGAPHHGVVVPLGEHDLVSVPNPDDPAELPIGIKVLDHAGAQVGEVASCPDLHGEATSGNMVALACATGLLLIEHGEGAPSVTHLPYPQSLPDSKATTLLGGRGLQYFLGNFGSDAIVLIDPTAEEPFRHIELPVRRVHFAIDPVRARFAYVLTEDGKLHQIDVLEGKIAQSVSVTGPYSMDGSWADARPRLAVAGDDIFVTDPLAGVIHKVDVENFAETDTVELGGVPFNIVAVGGTGTLHGEDNHKG
jgi:zinc transport system substrate-binding protein